MVTTPLLSYPKRKEAKVNIKSVGFIGGGRITKIILGDFQKAESISKNIVVSDSNIDVLNSLKEEYTEICITQDNKQAAMQDIVFVALHPPVMSTIISETFKIRLYFCFSANNTHYSKNIRNAWRISTNCSNDT